MNAKIFIHTIVTISICLAGYKAGARTYFKFDESARISNTNFSFFSVVDKRINKESIGFLKKGLNAKVDLQTEKSFENYLAEYINGISGKNTNTDTLILVLYDFNIEDRPNQDECGTFHFDGMFYLGSSDKYRFLSEVDTFFEIRSDWDITKLLLETSKNCTVEILNAVAGMSRKKSEVLMDYDQILTHRQDIYHEFAAYTTTSFKEGVYYTIKDFINQTPADTPFTMKPQVIGRVKLPFFYYLDSKGKPGVMIWDYFAIAKNDQAYFNDQNLSAVLKIVNGNIYTTRHFKAVARRDPQLSYMFGVAGGLMHQPTVVDLRGYGVYEVRLDPVKRQFNPVRRVQ